MLILNAGVPRSGTVLVNAMIRALLKQANVGTLQANPHGRELTRLVGRLTLNGDHRHKAVLVHTHSWDAETARILSADPQVVAFANYRDPRDVCVSLMRLHELTFADALNVVPQLFATFEATVIATGAMVMPYELLVAAKEAHVFQIARKLGLWPTLPQVHAVVEETSIERHRKIMEDVASGKAEHVAERQNRQRMLREDRMTLINDRHIQSGASGRWREELDETQQAEINKAFAPILERYGYEH